MGIFENYVSFFFWVDKLSCFLMFRKLFYLQCSIPPIEGLKFRKVFESLCSLEKASAVFMKLCKVEQVGQWATYTLVSIFVWPLLTHLNKDKFRFFLFCYWKANFPFVPVSLDLYVYVSCMSIYHLSSRFATYIARSYVQSIFTITIHLW